MSSKILFTIGSRANYGRLMTLITYCIHSEEYEIEIAVHSSALVDKYGGILDLLKENNHEPTYILHTLLHNDNAQGISKSLSLGIVEFATILDKSNPTFVVVGGDRYEILAPAVACVFHSAKLIHLQGGEVSGNVDDKVRNAVTQLADIHFPATAQAYDRLLRQGIPGEFVFNCGCPGMDVALNTERSHVDLRVLNRNGVGNALDPEDEFVLLIVHPESFGEAFNSDIFDNIFECLTSMTVVKNVIALWPNADLDNGVMAQKLRSILDKEKYGKLNIRVFKGFAPAEYIRILSASKFCIGNSSSFVREGAVIGKPAVLLGDRQSDREMKSNVRVVASNSGKDMEHAISWAISTGGVAPDYSYGRGNACKKIHDTLSNIR